MVTPVDTSNYKPLSMTIVVLVHFIDRENHSSWEWNACLNIKMYKYIFGLKLTNFQPSEDAIARHKFEWVKI